MWMSTGDSVMPWDLSQCVLRHTPHSFGQSAAAAQRNLSASQFPDFTNCFGFNIKISKLVWDEDCDQSVAHGYVTVRLMLMFQV